MVWTTPRTWTTGEIVTAANLNTHVRDNLNALFTRRFGHTYVIPGEIKVPAGDVDYIAPFYLSAPSNQVITLKSARYRINSGTSATCKLTKNDVDVTGFTGISITTSSGVTTPAAVPLADGDLLALVVTAVSGTPKNMTFSIFVDYEVQ